MLIAAYTLTLLAIVVVGLFRLWLHVRRQRTRLVVQTLATTIGQNLPLAPALRAAARAERGMLRAIYGQLATRLERGERLSLALRSTLTWCPGELLGAVEGAEQGGTLPTVLRAFASESHQEARRPTAATPPLWYPIILGVLLPGVLLYECVFILPKFVMIFEDFDTTLPQITLSVISLGEAVSAALPLLLILLLIAAIALVQSVLARNFFTRAPHRFQLSYALWDTFTWFTPGLRQLVRSRSLALQLPVLQAAVRAGHDLVAAARQAACVAVNLYARRGIRRWADAMQRGSNPRQAAADVGLPAPITTALTCAPDAAGLAARLGYLAEFYCALSTHWGRLVVSFVTPLMVMVWAVLIGYVVLALFIPLISLVESVMGTIY